MKPDSRAFQLGLIAVGAVALLWLMLPLLEIDGSAPFESPAARVAVMVGLAVLAIQGWAGWQRWTQRRNAKLLQQLQADPGASDTLAQRFAAAMELLRSGIVTDANKPARWWRPRRQLYQLPWYVFIGAPGAGKTTALLHAGLRFPLAERLGTAPVAGVGGTRQCDWWFTDKAVFIDTAGRYTTQDSHARTDAREWFTFLGLLRRWRPVQPINGVIVTVSVPDLLQAGRELDQQAAAVDRRLDELRHQLGQSFPVYLLVTKIDLLAGFVEYFADFDAQQREQAWGTSFELEVAPDGALPRDLSARLGDLSRQVTAMLPQRLQQEPLADRRAAIYSFAAQVDGLVPALERFARQAFRHCGREPAQLVRGIHLSSGTQEGNPIDRVLAELSLGYGIALARPPKNAQPGKAYFLAALLQRFVIAEAPLAGSNLARHRRWRRLVIAGAGALVVLQLLACGAWLVSYRNNAAYAAAVQRRLDQVVAQIDPAKAGRIDQLLPLYATLKQLAASGAVDPARPSWRYGFGLFQGPRLARSAEQTYHSVLDRTLAPVLVTRLNEALRQDANPAARYEALRTALMLITPGRLDRAEVRRWAAGAFAPNQGPGAGERQEWLRHLDALLERNAVLEAVRVDPQAVREARAALVRLPLDERVHERLLARAREQLRGEQTLADVASPGAVLAFAPGEAGSGIPSVPAVFTRLAWREVIEPSLDAVAAQVAAEATWVLGQPAPAVQGLAQQVGRRHALQTIQHWDRLLATLQVQVPDETAALARLATRLGAPDSPLRQLLARLATEFGPVANTSAATAAYDAVLTEHFGALRNYAIGAEARIDQLVVPVPAVLRDPGGSAAAELGRQLRVEAGRAPAPLATIWGGLAYAMARQQQRTGGDPSGSGLTELAQACRSLTTARFPFAADATRDMPLADFARVFGPGGLLDGWFRSRLAPHVDVRSRPWRFVNEAGGGSGGQAALRAFEQAEEIRRLFFSGGAELPQLRLRLTPLDMDPELLLFSADIDGQLVTYENGPRRPRAIVWPGPGATQRVVLRTLPPSPRDVGTVVHEGPWSLLRVLQRRSAGDGTAARLEVDGRALHVEVEGTDTASPMALLGRLSRFRCPEPW